MSDSDDTDILLLIPPDYFISSADEQLQQHQQEQQLQQLQRHFSEAQELLNATIGHILERNTGNLQMDEGAAEDALTMPPPTSAYQFLAPSRKAELNELNSRLHNIEREEDPRRFSAPSDISSISTSTVRTQFGPARDNLGMVHSTPKYEAMLKTKTTAGKTALRDCREDGVLLEIDNFLIDRPYNDGNWNHHSVGFQAQQQLNFDAGGLSTQHAARASSHSLPGEINRLSQERPALQMRMPSPVAAENNLISLSEIWGKSGQGQTTAIHIAGSAASKSALKEEQLRRQHLEKTVHLLQSRLLEYQQRLSVAIEVDRAKDAALNNAQLECKSLNMEVQQLHDAVFKMESEQRDYGSRMDGMQKELAQAVSLATKFQNKNEKLETELAACSRQTSECNNMYKQQVEELEIKLHGCKRAEELALNELTKLRDKYAKVEHQNDKLKMRSDELEKDCSTLRHQKEMLQDYHQKQKSRADALETQRKSLQETLANLTDNETTLKKKLESQQKSLKSHYQQQLENVVAQKLKEFQAQLDKTEECLKAEARDRERLIAERAVKQFELINEKNELELNLMQEKHNEEVELYRIQLANASKKIDDLEQKLSVYKTKRADIAEKLHDVMEAQWQKALEILTSPNQSRQIRTNADADSSPEDNATHCTNAQFETPKTSKCSKTNSKENNLNLVSNNQEQAQPMDRLQAYIELLLSKSPSDIDKLDKILALTKSKSNATKLDKSLGRLCHSKPPWKA